MSAVRPTGHTSVMADRARGEVESDDARTALLRLLEYFPTPPWAARAGGELILQLDPLAETCWEPACGEGHMAAGLAEYFDGVRATDIHDHGVDAGASGGPHFLADFLAASSDDFDPVDWIVTNPPFGLAAEFVAAGLRRAKRGVAILARVSLLESATRFGMFFQGEHRLYAFAPFIERVPMTLGGWDPKGSTATAYAWFVWVKKPVSSMAAICGRGDRAEVWPIGPGTRARLTRPDDARVWGRREAAPLFD